MSVTWTVNNLDFHKSLSGKSNVVFNIHWSCQDQDSDGNTGRVYGTVAIPTDDLSGFTAYADIKETLAVKWAKDALGSERVSELESLVAAEIAEKATPKQGTGVPW